MTEYERLVAAEAAAQEEAIKRADARKAISLYAIAARDFVDMLEMLPETSDAALATLYAMVVPENQVGRAEKGTDVELNKIIESCVRRQLEARGLMGTWETLVA